MSKYMRRSISIPISIAIVVISFISTTATAQLSKKLLAVLPPSCLPSPPGKSKLSIAEISAILAVTESNIRLHFNKEIDSLSAVLEELPAAARDTGALIAQLAYKYQKGDFEAALSYCNRTIALFGDNDKQYTPEYQGQKNYILTVLGRYEECIANTSVLLDKARQQHDSIRIADAFASYYMPYLSLGLNEASITCLDSSIAYYSKKGLTKNEAEKFRNIISAKFAGYLNLYEETGNSLYAEKMQASALYYRQRGYDFTTYAITPVVMALSEKDYAKTERLCDSVIINFKAAGKSLDSFAGIFLLKSKAISLYHLGKKNTAITLLDTVVAKTYANITRSPVLRPYGNTMLLQATAILYNAYKEINRNDKAFYYLELNKQISDSLDILKNRGKIFETNQRYNFSKKEAEERQLASDNLLRKKQRNIAIVITVAALLALVLTASILANRHKKLQLQKQLDEQEAHNRLEKLHMASQLQILELEEKNRMAKSEEQQRLHSDLHNDLSGILSATRANLESEIIKEIDNRLHETLKRIATQISAAYEQSRNSDDTHGGAGIKDDIVFSKRIQAITETVLPARQYGMEIGIDEEVSESITLPVKINLLYIIREALTNILKYAKASHVTISIGKINNEQAVLMIADNGRGFDADTVKARKGVGLQSIADRAKEISGVFDIRSLESGTKIRIQFPYGNEYTKYKKHRNDHASPALLKNNNI